MNDEYYPDYDQYLEEMEYWETVQKPLLEKENNDEQ